MSKSDSQQAAGRKAARFTNGVLALLALAIFINYVDRGNLATAAPLIKGELNLSNAQYGLLVSAFFWVYVPGQIVAAWLAQKINAYRTLALGLAVWSVATIASGLAGGFLMLLVLRVFLGIGESAGFPASSKLLAEHLPPERFGKANGLVSAGIYLGPTVGTFLGGLFIAHLGWRLLFIVFGAISILWLVPWVMSTRSLSAKAQSDIRIAEPPFRELLSKRELWGASIGHFCANYPFYLILSWLPLYLVKSHGYSITEMARLGGVVYGLATVVCLGSGWISDRWISAGSTLSRVRMTMICLCQFIWLVCMMACGFGNARFAIAGLLISSAAIGLAGPNLYGIGQTLAGARAAGKWIGIQNAIGNIAGIVAPVLTGVIIDWTGKFSFAFLAAGLVALVGACAWIFLVRRAEPIAWSDAQPKALVPS
ncbi:MAG TPA: MFS transporter [Silvibacterium sp.]|nr:MFS transporter [Silvibacterium sp.]